MKRQISIVLFALLFLTNENISGQFIVFGKTINLLEHIRPSVVPTYGKRIAGFKLVSTMDELRQSFSSGPLEQTVFGASRTDPPCPNRRIETRAFSGNLVSRLEWIGTVIGEDFSESDYCECSIHPANIYFQPIYVYFSDGTELRMISSKLPGQSILCPNVKQGHILSSDTDIEGAISTELTFTLRIADDEMSLLADIFYKVSP